MIMMLKFFTPYQQRLLEAKIRDRVAKYCLFSEITLFFFGSRVDGTATQFSDVDVGIMHNSGKPLEHFIFLFEEVAEIDSPYKVELVDFATVSDTFKNLAMKTILKF